MCKLLHVDAYAFQYLSYVALVYRNPASSWPWGREKMPSGNVLEKNGVRRNVKLE